MEGKRKYIVKKKKQETHDTSTLMLVQEDGTVPSFIPGQFISVYFPELNTPEGKSYSISNPSGEKTLNITVKGIGEFSNRLCAMELGDVLSGSLPYGFFYSEQQDTDLVMIAGGIGVAPFRGMIIGADVQSPKRKLSLFQSAQTATDLLFNSEFTSRKRLTIRYFITREQHPRIQATGRRMRVEDILEDCSIERSEFFICGSISFVRDIWKNLKNHGVNEDRIYTEAFFSH